MAKRAWTEEQREAARQRAKAQGFGTKGRSSPIMEQQPTKQAARVEEHEVPPVRNSDIFIAEQQGRVQQTVERNKDEDGNLVKTTHTRPGTLMMYKPLEHGGYEPRTVSVTAIPLLLQSGWSENCPDCGRKHIDKTGAESSDPNLCSARPPVAVILCPVCRLRIYDNVHVESAAASADDENVITPDDLQDSSPEQRLIAARNLHLWMHHPRAAQERNIPPLPAALRDMVQEARLA